MTFGLREMLSTVARVDREFEDSPALGASSVLCRIWGPRPYIWYSIK